jgi:hypothetical protein
MSTHEEMNSLLPEYAAGGLSAELRNSIESHLETCDECKEDLALWQMVSTETWEAGKSITAPKEIVERALIQVHLFPRNQGLLRRGWVLLKSQFPLVRHELWPASAAIMIIGYIAAILVGKEVIIQVLAPLVAAASIAMVFGPTNDPACELMSSVPTSPRQILLARLSIVFGYNFFLALLASVCLIPIFPKIFLPELIISWLAPMTFISALALFLSIYFGTDNAIIAAYFVWILKYALQGAFSVQLIQPHTGLADLLSGYSLLWQQPAVLFITGGMLLIGAIWAAGKVEYHSMDLV